MCKKSFIFFNQIFSVKITNIKQKFNFDLKTDAR